MANQIESGSISLRDLKLPPKQRSHVETAIWERRLELSRTLSNFLATWGKESYTDVKPCQPRIPTTPTSFSVSELRRA